MMNSIHSSFVATCIVFFFAYSLVATTEAAGAVKLTKKKTKKKGRSPSYVEQPTKDKKYLAVQVGRSCTLRKGDDDGDGGAGQNSVHLIVTTGTTLVSFTERPVRSAVTLGTETFVQNFSKTFSASKPNTAVTFASDGDKQGTLITKFSQANIVQTLVEDNSVVIDYTIQQVGSQGDNGMLSFLDLFENDDDASVTLRGGCTLFIDSFPVDEYNSQTDYCYRCGENSSCWNKSGTLPSPQGCSNAVGLSGIADNRCGIRCKEFYDSQTDYCFNCGSGSSANCWNKEDILPNNPQCLEATGTSEFGDNQCGNPCLPNVYVPGTKNICYSCTDGPPNNCWNKSFKACDSCTELTGEAANVNECGKECENGAGGVINQ